MFHTLGYRGHHIHLSTPDRHSKEEIRVRIGHTDGGFHLISCKTLIGAMRAITRHVRTTNPEGRA